MVYRKVVFISHFTRNLVNLMGQKSRYTFSIITYFTKIDAQWNKMPLDRFEAEIDTDLHGQQE